MRTYIIAEIGVNHNGSVDEAFRLIDAAKDAGVDAVKFQLFDAEKLKRPEIKHLELSKAQLTETYIYAKSVSIDWICTPFDIDALRWVVSMNPPYIKLASGAIFNKPLLKAAGNWDFPIILSTGMSSLHEVRRAVDTLGKGTNLTLLHCTSAYPAPLESANLLAMLTLKRAMGCPVGYSDHTVYLDTLVVAAALGASIIEAHITRNSYQDGPDHLSSYEPIYLKLAIKKVRSVEAMLGNGVKQPQPCELPTRSIWHGKE